MTNKTIPIEITFLDLENPDQEYPSRAEYTGGYDWGTVIAASIEDLSRQGIERLVTERPELKATADAGNLFPIAFGKGGERMRFVVNGAYRGEGGPFGDEFQAVDEADATMQALWTMAQNHFSDRGDDNASLSDMVGYMAECSVFDATPEPVAAHEQRKLFVDLVEALRGNGGDPAEALSKAEEALLAMGEIQPRSPAHTL